MQRAEFEKLLERFRVVRRSDFVNFEANEDSADINSAPSSIRARTAPERAPGHLTTEALAGIADGREFWTILNEFLAAHFTPNDAKAVKINFDLAHTEMLERLSLDDLEDIARHLRSDRTLL